MSSGGKCPLTGNVLWWVFACLCTFRISGRKKFLVGKVLWWELSSGGACPICFPTLLYLPNCSPQIDKGVLPHHSCSTRRFFPTTPAPPGVPSHHSCSTKRFFPTTPASQGFASHSSLPTTPVPHVFSFPPLLLHKGLLHTILSPPNQADFLLHLSTGAVRVLSGADTVRKVVGKSSLNSPGHLVPAALGGVFFFFFVVSAHLHWKLA